MGPQSVALAGPARASGPPLLLRVVRLHRDLSLRPRLEREYHQVTGRHCSAEGLADRLRGQEAAAEQVFRVYEDRLARSLASVINLLDPEVIVLGGGLSNFERLYQTIPALWSGYIFSDVVNTRLLPPVHGDASGVRGAAWLWED